MNYKKIVSDIVCSYKTTDPYQLARYLEIDVDLFPFRRIKGFIMRVPNSNATIVLNENMPEYEQKAFLCHELGHYFLSPANASYLFITSSYMHSKYEYEANCFMVEFLIYGKKIELDETIDMYARRVGVPLEMKSYIKF